MPPQRGRPRALSREVEQLAALVAQIGSDRGCEPRQREREAHERQPSQRPEDGARQRVVAEARLDAALVGNVRALKLGTRQAP